MTFSSMRQVLPAFVVASVSGVAAQTYDTPPGFNQGFAKALDGSPQVPGAQRCMSAKTASGFPYTSDPAIATFEHGPNPDGPGCADKLQSYVDFQVDAAPDGHAVAPQCFRSCPADNPDGTKPPCAHNIWSDAEAKLTSAFGTFKQAYDDYETQHGVAVAAKDKYAQTVADKDSAVTATMVALRILVNNQDDPAVFDASAPDGLNASNPIVSTYKMEESKMASLVAQAKVDGDDKRAQNKKLREEQFQLEMARLRYRDALYQEVWARDNACAVKLNNDKWKTLFADAQSDYEQKASEWQSNESAQRQSNQDKIDAQKSQHDTQMAEDEKKQRDARSAWASAFLSSLQAEDAARAADVAARGNEVNAFTVMAKLVLTLSGLLADNSQGTHSGPRSQDSRRNRILSEVEFQRLLSESAESEAQMAELKSRVASSLSKTLKLDPATSAIEISKITPMGSQTYAIDYKISMSSADDAKRIAPAIAGAGKPIFQKVMKGHLEAEIAGAKDGESTVLSKMSISDVSSDAKALRVSQRSSASSSSSSSAATLVSGAMTAYGANLVVSVTAMMTVMVAVMQLQ